MFVHKKKKTLTSLGSTGPNSGFAPLRQENKGWGTTGGDETIQYTVWTFFHYCYLHSWAPLTENLAGDKR